MAATSGYWLTTKANAPSTAFSTSGFAATRVSRSSGGRTYYNYRVNADTSVYAWQNWNATQPSSATATLPLVTGVVQGVYSFSASAVTNGTLAGYVLSATRYAFAVSGGTGGTVKAVYSGTTTTASYGYVVQGTSDGSTYDGTSTWCRPIALTATTGTGYAFDGWYVNGTRVSTATSYTVTSYSGDVTYTAVWHAVGDTVTAVSENSAKGSVTGSGTYNYGSTVTLTATPNTGYQFAAWTRNGVQVSTSATYSFTLSTTNAGTYTATFTAVQYQITASVTPSGAGTVNGAGTYSYGDTVSLGFTQTSAQALLNPFSHWTKDGAYYSSNASISFTATASAAFVAVCSDTVYGVYAFEASNDALGTISDEGGSYVPGTTVSCTASADSAAEFVNWTDSGGNVVSTSATYSFTSVSGANETYTANFVRPYATITGAVSGSGGTVTGGARVRIGSTVTLTATPSTGYAFLRWTDGIATSTRTVAVTGDETYTAVFEQADSSSPIPPAPANPDDLYIVRDLRADGSRIYPHSCDMVFLKAAVADRLRLVGGTVSSDLSAAANQNWHAAVDMRACGSAIPTVIGGVANSICWASPSARGFPAASASAWGSTSPTIAGGVQGIGAVCTTTGFFVTRAGVANDSILTTPTDAATGKPIRENHVRSLYYDLCDRGTNLVLLMGSTQGVLDVPYFDIVQHQLYRRWGYDPSGPTDTATSYNLSPFSNAGLISAVGGYGYNARPGRRYSWSSDYYVVRTSGVVSLSSAAQGKVSGIQFLSLIRLTYATDVGSTSVEYRLVPVLWTPSNLSSIVPPWLDDSQAFRNDLAASNGVLGDPDALAHAAASQGATSPILTFAIDHMATYAFVHLNLDTNVESYGWTPVYPTPAPSA